MTDGKTGELGPGRWAATYGWYTDGGTTWNAGIPWWRPPSIDWLERKIEPGWTVLEYGCGGSTIWLARLGCKVVSLELDAEWKNRVQRRLELEGLALQSTVRYFGPQNTDEQRWETYADYALMAADETYNLVIVDGRNRARCLANVQRKVKVGGYVLLDNSDRVEYIEGVRLYDDWAALSWGDEGWMTTIYERPAQWTPPPERIVLPNQEA